MRDHPTCSSYEYLKKVSQFISTTKRISTNLIPNELNLGAKDNLNKQSQETIYCFQQKNLGFRLNGIYLL